MPGRKPKPTKLKVLKGTAQNCRLNKNEPDPEVQIPDPPKHLTKDALKEWERQVPELYRLGLLSLIDRTALANYCQSYGRWVEAESELNGTGLLVKTTNGNIIQNPLVGIIHKEQILMHRYLTEFGMTPASRSRVSTSKKDEKKEKSPWASLKNG